MSIFAVLYTRSEDMPWTALGSFEVTDTVQFSTQLNGGFMTGSFVITGDRLTTAVRYRNYIGAKVTLYDHQGSYLFEGEVTSSILAQDGVHIEMTGLYEKGAQVFFDMIYAVEQATDNLVVNPSFENNVTDGWTKTGGGSVARSTSAYLYGGASAKITLGGSITKFYTVINVTAGQVYTLSLRAQDLDASGGTMYLFVSQYDSGNNLLNTVKRSMTGINSSAFVVLDKTVTIDASCTYVAAGVEVPIGSGSIYIDGVQFENLSGMSGYCDGSQGTGYTWNGTAHNSVSHRDYIAPTVGQVIFDCVGLIPDWKATNGLIVDATAFVDSADYTDKKVKESIEAALAYGYAENDIRPTYFAIWETGVPMVIRKPDYDYRPNWLVPVDVLDGGIEISTTLDGVFNKVYAAMDNKDGIVKTVAAEDLLSQALYGIREGVVNNGNNPEGLALANDLRDMALAEYKWPLVSYSVAVSGCVFGFSGNMEYPYKIRAGDTILINNSDLIYQLGGDRATEVREGLVGFVMSTDYSGADNTCRLTFSTDTSFDSAMGRLGLSGGLS